MPGSIICENCRAANHRECQKPFFISSKQEGGVKTSKMVCCDDVVIWYEQSAV
jgi:hypothetical protein